jgi:hypothetical protein
MDFTISLSLPNLKVTLTQKLIATDPHDNEQNAKRMADQMITELFRRYTIQELREHYVRDNSRR